MCDPSFNRTRRWLITIEQYSAGGVMNITAERDGVIRRYAIRNGESFQLNVNPTGVQVITEKQERTVQEI